MVQITNGAGGDLRNAAVDSKNRLKVFATAEPTDRTINHEGKSWSCYFTATPTATNDYIFYLENTGINPIHITDIRIMCAAADTFTYEEITGIPVDGTTLVPKNRNFGSNKIPTATIESGNDITGLTVSGTPVFFERCDTVNKREKLSTSSNIIVAQGTAFAIKAVTGTALTTCVVSIAEEDA